MHIEFDNGDYYIEAEVDNLYPVHIISVADDMDNDVSSEIFPKELHKLMDEAYEFALQNGYITAQDPYDMYNVSRGDF